MYIGHGVVVTDGGKNAINPTQTPPQQHLQFPRKVNKKYMWSKVDDGNGGKNWVNENVGKTQYGM